MKHIKIYESFNPIRNNVSSEMHNYSNYFEQAKEHLKMSKESIIIDSELSSANEDPSYRLTINTIEMAHNLVDKLENGKLEENDHKLTKHILDAIELYEQSNKYNL